MWDIELFKTLEENSDFNQGNKMAAYMQNKFHFLGIPKPKLVQIVKPFLKESKKYDFNWEFVFTCWHKDYREAQYVGIMYLIQNTKKIKTIDLPKLKDLIITKSWWETVDSIDAIVGELVLKDKELERVMLDWSISENMWLRRVAIDFQQAFKDKTNCDLLESIIVNNLNSKEFFINKAIGWSLREYSKVNPKWVKDFIQKYPSELSNLSIKESSKYL